MRFTAKTALITGGSSGIGLSCATRLLAEGAELAILDKLPLPADLNGNPKVRFWQVDLTDTPALEAALQEVAEAFPDIDLALNNAGIDGLQQPLADTTLENYRAVMAINLDATFWCLRWEMQHMMARKKGAILNMASISGLTGFANLHPYSASKGALIQLTRTAAIEAAPAGVRVNALCPSVVETPLVEHFINTSQDPAATQHWFENFNPLPGMVTREAVAAAAAFLLSDEAAFITGVNLPIDGGYTAK